MDASIGALGALTVVLGIVGGTTAAMARDSHTSNGRLAVMGATLVGLAACLVWFSLAAR